MLLFYVVPTSRSWWGGMRDAVARLKVWIMVTLGTERREGCNGRCLFGTVSDIGWNYTE